MYTYTVNAKRDVPPDVFAIPYGVCCRCLISIYVPLNLDADLGSLLLIRLEAIATRVETIPASAEAIAIRVETIHVERPPMWKDLPCGRTSHVSHLG